MNKHRVLLSLITESNDYQQEQASQGAIAAQRLGIALDTIFADGDAIMQSQQLLQAVQSKAVRPDAIMLEPVGTGLAVVARAAVSAGIAWIVMNREVDYLRELRTLDKAPCFEVSADHLEVGRIQGRQIAALLPHGGNVLFIQGPTNQDATRLRTAGFGETKPANIQLRTLKGHWTEASGYEAVASWLRLSTSHQASLAAVLAQNDDMAIGARRAFQENTTGEERSRLLGVPFLGCDGLPKTGQAYIAKGLLHASVFTPALTGHALEILERTLSSGRQPSERTLIAPSSIPTLDVLAKRAAGN
ncbi:MAG TPA: sugar ABC transporter substrate-binding protein [Terriglobales bacterium]|nr:sugar ABC transporter substrate-binding protein [Terriglobales bacterium]